MGRLEILSVEGQDPLEALRLGKNFEFYSGWDGKPLKAEECF